LKVLWTAEWMFEKTLRGSRRLEPLHLALSSPHDLMGVFIGTHPLLPFLARTQVDQSGR
jgi:hypothetical protein